MEKPKGYRGPPPRKDLVMSPSREREWKGNDLFSDADMVDERERTQTPCSEIGIAPGLNGEVVDPHLKSQRDYGSDYSKLALNGGHKDLLYMDANDGVNEANVEKETSRRQKGCDDLSEYNRLAVQGGHKDLLRMDVEQQQDSSRRNKGCDNVSEYNRVALQGGHRDLLVIEENKPSSGKVAYSRKGGDWFAHSSNDGSPKGNKTATNVTVKPSNPPPVVNKPSAKPSPAKPYIPTDCLPGGQEQVARFGKKRFDSAGQRREAPFATNY